VNEQYIPLGYGKPEPSPSPEPTPRAESFPATLIFVASVGIALAVIGLFAYFKKRHGNKNP
jgi:hypothetical protein